MRDIWTVNASQFIDIDHASQRNVLHPTIARLVKEARPRNLLDYGCGDGRILDLLDEEIEIDVYDKSSEMLSIVERLRGDRINQIYRAPDSIKSSSYDLVILSMVLVCIDSREEFSRVLTHIERVLKMDGIVIISTSHPCFRQFHFSNFYTSVSAENPLKYLEDGSPFEVTIYDNDEKKVVFTDYHWSLSYTINTLIEVGLVINQMIETEDDRSSSNTNESYSPFLILKCRKHEK